MCLERSTIGVCNVLIIVKGLLAVAWLESINICSLGALYSGDQSCIGQESKEYMFVEIF